MNSLSAQDCERNLCNSPLRPHLFHGARRLFSLPKCADLRPENSERVAVHSRCAPLALTRCCYSYLRVLCARILPRTIQPVTPQELDLRPACEIPAIYQRTASKCRPKSNGGWSGSLPLKPTPNSAIISLKLGLISILPWVVPPMLA